MKKILLLALVAAAAGCSIKDHSEHMKCWSNGVVIYEGDSGGYVSLSHGTYYFRDKADGKRKAITANCVNTY